MSYQRHLYAIDFSKFAPANLDQLFAQEQQRMHQKIARLTSMNLPDINKVFGEANYEENLVWEQNFAPLSHLTNVLDTPEFRQAYSALLPKIAQLELSFWQNAQVYQVFQQLANSHNYATYTTAQKRALHYYLAAFKRMGVALAPDKKAEFQAVETQLMQAQARFSANLLDARTVWHRLVTDVAELPGLSPLQLQLLAKHARDRGLEGYLLSLDPNAVQIILGACSNRQLRQEVYQQVANLASVAPYDNTAVVNEIVMLKQRKAQLLGFENYASLNMQSKMLHHPQQVIDFIASFTNPVREKVHNYLLPLMQEYAELHFSTVTTDATNSASPASVTNIANTAYPQLSPGLQPYDLAYVLHQVEVADHGAVASVVAPEPLPQIREYFELEHVRQTLFSFLQRLYQLEFKYVHDYPVFHPDVDFYQVYEQGELIAGIYMDLHARAGKRGGAWVWPAFARNVTSNDIKLPVIYLTTNFDPKVTTGVNTLTHEQVVTLFHEMGHALHHILGKTELEELQALNVEWDAVEIPSKFNENWCYHPQGLAELGKHITTGEPLPEVLIQQLVSSRASRTAAYRLLRQLEYSTADMRLYAQDADFYVTRWEVEQPVVATATAPTPTAPSTTPATLTSTSTTTITADSNSGTADDTSDTASIPVSPTVNATDYQGKRLVLVAEDAAAKSVQQVFHSTFECFTGQQFGKAFYTNFCNNFMHIFSGNYHDLYAAGYYSYLYAEVLALDAFQAFAESGDIFNPELAASFKQNILYMGATYPSYENFLNFRGQQPSHQAFLRTHGLTT